MTLGATVPAYVSANEYYRVGETIADILQLVIGSIPKKMKETKEELVLF